MFYSHEILTSRRHGVATIWLVATLGSKSSLKKVSRRAILDVDVPKACETIADPESPMALRLQSSLLYGVSRVFSQQCGYILVDTQSLHDKMRGISLVMRDLQIDNNGTVTNNDHLNLPTDPTFNFDLHVGLDLSIFGISTEASERSSLLSPHSLRSSQSSLLPEEEDIPQIELPSFDTPGNDFMGFDFDAAAPTSSVQHPFQYAIGDMEEPAIDLNPAFMIDDDDMLIEQGDDQISAGAGTDTVQNTVEPSGSQINDDRGHVIPAGFQDAMDLNFDDGIAIMGDDDEQMAVDQPVTPAPMGVNPALLQRVSRSRTPEGSDHSEESEHTAEAPQRRARHLRPLIADQTTELSNRQLSDWQNEYSDMMALARYEKAVNMSLAQARRNASFWVLDQGIRGALVNFGGDRESHPLAIFSGQTLIDALTGPSLAFAARKRSRSVNESEGDDENGEIESKRARTESEENIGRGTDGIVLAADDGIMFQGDDDEIESQMGRQLASSLKDQPSSMPWNIAGSSRQSSLRAGIRPGISSSVRGIGLDLGPPSILSGRLSRLTSASPLLGRGRSISRLASVDAQGGNDTLNLDTNELGDALGGTINENDDFELYGPAAGVSTQQAAQSQWLNAVLEEEAYNFLTFLDQQITTKSHGSDLEPSISFAMLLPPKANSNIVAAQGILHVLALATKGLVDIQQEEAFGDIVLKMVKQVDDHEQAEEGIVSEEA